MEQLNPRLLALLGHKPVFAVKEKPKPPAPTPAKEPEKKKFNSDVFRKMLKDINPKDELSATLEDYQQHNFYPVPAQPSAVQLQKQYYEQVQKYYDQRQKPVKATPAADAAAAAQSYYNYYYQYYTSLAALGGDAAAATAAATAAITPPGVSTYPSSAYYGYDPAAYAAYYGAVPSAAPAPAAATPEPEPVAEPEPEVVPTVADEEIQVAQQRLSSVLTQIDQTAIRSGQSSEAPLEFHRPSTTSTTTTTSSSSDSAATLPVAADAASPPNAPATTATSSSNQSENGPDAATDGGKSELAQYVDEYLAVDPEPQQESETKDLGEELYEAWSGQYDFDYRNYTLEKALKTRPPNPDQAVSAQFAEKGTLNRRTGKIDKGPYVDPLSKKAFNQLHHYFDYDKWAAEKQGTTGRRKRPRPAPSEEEG